MFRSDRARDMGRVQTIKNDSRSGIPAQVYLLRYTPAGIPYRVPFFWSVLDRQYSIGGSATKLYTGSLKVVTKS